MNLRSIVSCALACGALLLAGCDEGRQAPARVNVRIANAAPGFANLGFIRARDARNAVSLPFKGTSEAIYDADTYNFSVGSETSASGEARTWTFTHTLAADNFYTFVLADVAGEVQTLILENRAPPATEAQISAVHAGGNLPAMDLYLERPGVGIAGATPVASVNALQQIAPRVLPSGDYELWVTAAGNPANVLLATTTIPLPAGITSIFVVVPEAGQGTEQLSVMLLQGASGGILYDRDATAELRVINAANDQAPRDLAVDSQFSPPLFSAMPFGEPTSYASVPGVPAKINVTPVGNPGVLELDQSYTGTAGQRATMLFNGPAGTLVATFGVDDGRRIHGAAKIRFMNASSQFFGIDFVLAAPDADPTPLLPLTQLFPPGITASDALLAPAEYDLYLYEYGTLNVVSGPTRISVAAGGLYGVLVVDGPDTATASVLLLDDFP